MSGVKSAYKAGLFCCLASPVILLMKVCQNRGNGEIGVRSHSQACVVPEIPVRRCVIEHSDLCHRMLQPLNLFSLWFPSKVAGDFQLSLMAFMFNAKPGNSLVHSLPVSHFILCCFPVESSNTPFPFAKLQASHRGTTRWLSQALRVGKNSMSHQIPKPRDFAAVA